MSEFFGSLADAAANREIIKQGGTIDNSIPCRFAKMQRKFDPDGRITAIYMENPLLKLLLDAAAEKTGKTLFIKPPLKTIEGGKNEKVHQAAAQDHRGQQKLPIVRNQLVASPKGWETIVDLCNRRRSLKEVMSGGGHHARIQGIGRPVPRQTLSRRCIRAADNHGRVAD